MDKEKKTNKAIVYDGWFDAARNVAKKDKSMAYDYLMAILETQFYGEREESDPYIDALMIGVDFSLLRREEKINTGSVGGSSASHNRLFPYALIYQLKSYHEVSNAEVREITGCSERTIKNAVDAIAADVKSGQDIEVLMAAEQQNAKFADKYAKYFAFLQNRLL